MKYVKYILFVLTLIVASCTIDDDVTDKGKNGGGNFRLMCRVMPFEGYNVLSRANVNGVGENDIMTLDYVILAKLQNNGDSDDYRCIYYNHFGGTVDEIITIDIDKTFKDFIENNQGSKEGLKQCYIAVLANYPELYSKMVNEAAGNYSTINDFINAKIVYKGDVSTYDDYVGSSYFTSVTHSVEPISGVPSTGIPRLGNFKGDGSGLVDITTFEGGNIYEVTLESLYAKMVFDINVDSVTQEIVGVNGNTFSLEGYTIHNLAQTVDMVPGVPSAEGEKGGTDDQVYVYKYLIDPIGGDPTSIHYTSPREVEFTCYLPERYLPAEVAANDYNYPFASGGADAARPEDRKLLQRYKPLIAQDNATYVKFSGTFVNHQGHSFDVSYKIYVGNDNYSNFDVVRNRQYNNIITIKGIDNSRDQSNITDEDGNLIAVSIDHRVDVQRTLPIIVNLRRETLLDAHFEVRPLRIRANNNRTGSTLPAESTPAAKIEVVYDDNDEAKDNPTKRWIGLERSYGNGDSNNARTTYCNGTNQSAHGKRKYFTTDLTTATLAGSGTFENGLSTAGGQTVIVPVNTAGECVWIYVDECLEASTDLKAIRSAKIVLTNGYVKDGSFTSEGAPIEYTINQHKLFKIQSKNDLNGNGSVDANDCYYIEHEEEYLYNFDADDAFGQNTTEFEGMKWGLDGEEISDSSRAFFVNATLEFVENTVIPQIGIYYDFYLPRDITSTMDDADSWSFAGFKFTKDIVSAKGILLLSLDEQPESAVQYCYGRNKVKLDAYGNVASVDYKWYMPAIDELEDIMAEAYDKFTDFQAKYYWSSQPAFFKNYGVYYSYAADGTHGDYYVDNPTRARATKVEYLGNNQYSPPVSSAMDGYNELLEVYGGFISWGWTYEPPVYIGNLDSYSFVSKYSRLWGSYRLTVSNPRVSYLNHPGNKLRTDKCRVRAVRRME